MKTYNLINSLLFFSSGITITGCSSSGNKNVKGNNDKPNILLIVSEDNSAHLSCYGDQVIKTPNLDKIATDGILFRNAYVTQSVSSPSRSSIFSGLYPHQSGHLGLATHGYRYVGNIKNIYQILKEDGYRTGMIGKLHVNPESDFPIDFHPIKGSNFAKKNLAAYSEHAGTFINESDDPFFLMVNFPDAHHPFQDTVENRPANPVTPEDVIVFPQIGFENERIRKYTTNIYNCMLRLDECVGELMQELRESGKEENTLVVYLGDHGTQVARGKYFVYEASNKVPLLMKWNGRIKKGIESEVLVSTVDLVVTFCDILGLDIPENVTGKSLAPVWEKPDMNFREYLYVERNSDFKDFHYPQRAVRDKRYKLIYTLIPERKDPGAMAYTDINAADAIRATPTREELKTAPANIQAAYQTWIQPPELQLYDLENDPWEFNDLSEDPDYDMIKNELFEKIKKWQETTDDPLRFPDKLKALTTEHDTIKTSSKRNWLYPKYLYEDRE